MKQFRKIDIPDRIVTTFQDNSAEVFDILTKLPILDGQVVTHNVAIGTNQVEHKLGRNYIGWILVDAEGAVTISHATKGTQADKYIYVQSGAATSATFWIF